MKKYTCPCCGYKTLDEEHEYDICPICFWQDDYLQFEDVDRCGGANNVSLRQAQHNYLKFGACEERCLESVRKANTQDVKDENWILLNKINLKDLYLFSADVIRNFLTNKDSRELMHQLSSRIDSLEAIDINDQLISECYLSIYHMDEPYCFVSDQEMQYYVDCFEGKITFSKEHRDNIITSKHK